MSIINDQLQPRFAFFAVIICGLILVGCATLPEADDVVGVTSSPGTPMLTATSTASPTPTATAPSLVVREAIPDIPQEPNPLGLITRCGVADFFDFPLDPPDAATVTGGQDFGVYRERYEGFHTGEDWWYERWRSLGKPIYSIGNGRVRFAAPFGWGEDLGTLVIEHILPDGRRVYSFYGHLDPESLRLRVGQCVLRGEQVGAIGDPKSSPHLHFEVRVIFADAPGPGYWSVDPSKSGWYPPSQTIEFSRYAADQRLRWWAATDATSVKILGWLDQVQILVEEDNEIAVYNIATGEELLRFLKDGMGIQSGWNPRSQQLYLVDFLGELRAYAWDDVLKGFEDPAVLDNWIWDSHAEGRGIPQLIPLGSGVLVAWSDHWWVFDGDGHLLWSEESGGRFVDWITGEAGVLALIAGEQNTLWTLTSEGSVPWRVHATGKLLSFEERAFLYSPDGLFELDESTMSVQILFRWERARINHAGLLEDSDGGLLILLKDTYDHRILNIDPTGRLSWERSVQGIGADEAMLRACGGSSWLLTEDDRQSSVHIRLFRLDEPGFASEIFNTVIRDTLPANSWMHCNNDASISLSLGGQRRILLDLADQDNS